MPSGVDPDKLSSVNLAAGGCHKRLYASKTGMLVAGQIGQGPPSDLDWTSHYTMGPQGRLAEPEQFREHRPETGADGEVTYLCDVPVAVRDGAARSQTALCRAA